MNKFLAILIAASSLVFWGCLQDDDEDLDRIPVQYTVLVRDGVTGKAVKDASVELTSENGVAKTLKTNSNGKVVFPSAESYVNQVIVTMDGYVPTDTVDVVTTADSSYSLMLRTLNLALIPEGVTEADTGRYYRYTVTVLDETTMDAISGANVSVTSGNHKAVDASTDKNGRAILDSLPSKQNLFSVSASGFTPVDTLVVADTSGSDDLVLQTLRILLVPSVSK